MKQLITIIVPIYKAEKYLDKCIESLVNQTYTNIEIILVNDGSHDNCFSICEKWKRNAGMKIAKGKYFIFVDSDDYVSKDYVGDLFDILKANKADIAVGKMEKFLEGSSLESRQNDREYILTFNSTEAIQDFL